MLYIIGLLAVVLGIVLDQVTKYLAAAHLQSHTVVIIEDVFELQYLENRGAAFGMFQNQQWFFLIVGLGALLVPGYMYVKLPKEKRFLPMRICILALIAGAIGNMIDRVRLQYVIDFFYFKLINFPIFNVADIFASVSAFFFVVLFLFYYKEKDLDIIFGLFSRRTKKGQE